VKVEEESHVLQHVVHKDCLFHMDGD
jgi:hypothetical protein